jgi:hypothetical protein
MADLQNTTGNLIPVSEMENDVVEAVTAPQELWIVRTKRKMVHQQKNNVLPDNSFAINLALIIFEDSHKLSSKLIDAINQQFTGPTNEYDVRHFIDHWLPAAIIKAPNKI